MTNKTGKKKAKKKILTSSEKTGKKKAKKKTLTSSEKKSVWTTFTLLFPSLILTLIITIFPRSLEISVVAILLFFYQAILLKSFVEAYYEVKH